MAKVVDVSLEGCLVVLEEAEEVFVGTTVEVSFTVKGLVFRMRGQVRAVRSATVVGLQFDCVSERTRGQVEDLVDELTEEARKRNSNKAVTGEGRISPNTIPMVLDLSSMTQPRRP